MRFVLCYALLAILFLSLSVRAEGNPDSLSFDKIVQRSNLEFKSKKISYFHQLESLQKAIDSNELLLMRCKRRKGKRYSYLLEKKIELTARKRSDEILYEEELLIVRYKKGLDLIRLLYEKLLGLDHHFTSLQTFHNISLLTNPHTFPDFREATEELRKKENKRFSMRLPAMLDSNPFLTATFSLVTTLLGVGKPEEKEKDFEKISCILDFTVRMNGDLNLIKHETDYLKIANQELIEDCERLFAEFASVIGYHIPLETCRNKDDWMSLYTKLDEFRNHFPHPSDTTTLVHKPKFYQINLEFATQKVADFITIYTNYVNDGIQYYQKFDNIISTYENEQACHEQLPGQFTELKRDIKSTIEKFNNTYAIPEIQGSRLKSLLFGAY